MFVEEPCPPENVKAMKRISDRTTLPIATGERLITHYGCREVIEGKVVDILQPDVNHVGGISALWKVGAMAEASGVMMAPHACEGPVGAVLHPRTRRCPTRWEIQRRRARREGRAGKSPGHPMRMVGGYYPLPTKPGLGLEVDERALNRHPFGGTKPFVSLPVHEDGSIASP
jgi:galactonate dehydratase